MLKYLIRKKAASDLYVPSEAEGLAETREDLLTSDALGTVACYVPSPLLLLPLFGEMARQNPHSKKFSSWVGSLEGKNVTAAFWPHYDLPPVDPPWTQARIEPDVVIRCDDGTSIFVEAKYTSRVDEEQLVREAWVGMNQPGSDYFLLLVTADLTAPRVGKDRQPFHEYVARRLVQLTKGPSPIKLGEMAEHILWSNWQTLYRTTEAFADRILREGAPDDFMKSALNLVKDLMAVLELRELVPFQVLAYDELIRHQPDASVIYASDAEGSARGSNFDLDNIAELAPSAEAVTMLFREIKR